MVYRFLICLFIFWLPLAADPLEGRLLFLIQQGEHAQAITLYKAFANKQGKHDFELLHKMGLGLLHYGFEQRDPEIQLLSLFGASVSAHEDAYSILEEALTNRYPQIQLIAIGALSKLHHDRADQSLLKALGAPHLLVRLEAAHQLCLKKHPEAVNQTESLMYKMPKILLPLYPPLLASAGTQQAMRILRKLLQNPSEDVRLSVLISAVKYKRDDLLPQIRQQALQAHHTQQEVCLYALGLFHDNHALAKLQKSTGSSFPSVALAAHVSLYRLGQEESLAAIEEMAKQKNLFAIQVLGELTDRSPLLEQLVQHADRQVRLNAVLALLKQKNPLCLRYLSDILIRNHKDLAFSPLSSPGKMFKAWKVISSASQTLQEDASAYSSHLELKETILESARHLKSEAAFIQLAHQILDAKQNDLVPSVTEILEDIGSSEAIACLKKHHQQLGAPLVRNYCNLALYRLKEAGPYKEQLCQWVKTQHQTEFIRLKTVNPWEMNKDHYGLTPEETSQLLIQAFEAFAINQDEAGVEVLLEAVANGHPKNKYALAGLLLRATQ